MKKRLIIGIAAFVLAAPVAANAAKPAPTQTLKGTLIDWSIVHGNVQGTVIDADGQPHRFIEPPASVPKALDIGRVLRLQGRITRDASGLAEAADQVDFWCRYALSQTFLDPAGWTLQNMLTLARLMIAAAREREESRGTHTRRDFPQTDPSWARHIPFLFV